MRKLIALLLLAGLFACNNSHKKQSDKTLPEKKYIPIEDRILYPATSISPLFDSLRPAMQNFTIKGYRDTLIVGKNGTAFSILKNTFINAQSQPATTITINLVEANSTTDIIKCNLQTTAGNNILQTGGMFFLDAKENGKSLAMAEGKSIFVETRSGNNNAQMEIFEGKFDNKGKIDWTTIGNLENTLIALPFNLLKFNHGWECLLSEEQIKLITQPKFENTFLATREFEERAVLLNFASCEQYKSLSQQLLNIYISNTDKPLFISDSLAADYLIKNNKAQIDTTRKFEFDDTGWITYFYQLLLLYAQQRLTQVINFDKLGITQTTTIEELVSKGLSQPDAEKYIACFKLRNQAIQTRKAEKQTNQLASYSFSINKLGWVNVDCFLNQQNTAISTFVVQTKCKDSLDFVSVSLVIPQYYISVFSIHNDGNLYSFTKKEDGYRKLPVGEDAWIVAFAYKNNKPWFGKQKIKIPKDGRVVVELKQTTKAALKRDISKLAD